MGRPALPKKTKRSESKAAKDPTRTVKQGRIGKEPRPKKKKHAEYRERNLRSGVINCLEYRRHDATRLVLEAIDTFSSGAWSETQHEAIEQFKEAYVVWSRSDKDISAVQHIIPLFNSIFFLDKLNQVDFRWFDFQSFDKDRAVGKCWVSKTSRPTAYISMDPRDRHSERRDRDHFASHIGTLLHELCHAFVRFFSCRGHCNNLQCIAGQSTTFGDTGHAKAWFLLAAGVQTVARRIFPWLDVRLGIFAGFLRENNRSRYIPGADEWKKLFDTFSRTEMWDLFAELTGDGWRKLREAYYQDSLTFEKLQDTWEDMREKMRVERGTRFQWKSETNDR